MTDRQQERYRALGECLIMFEAQQRMFSRNESMLWPKDGYERPWEEAKTRCRIIREMLQEVRYGDRGEKDQPAAADAPAARNG